MEVRAWQELVIIPTYQTGEPDKNPMFLEKRVYQGSSGAVYPHAVIDKITDIKVDKSYNAIFLENDYLKIMILPELGGRIQMALDKTNNYHFVYYNQVIKPALVGLAGPWISGGIEFNWPQHHRPSTFEAVDFCIEENDDESKTVWVNEIEQMFHTKGMAGFTLYPDKAYLEIKGKLYNRTALPQTFLWWANPAVAVDDQYQSVFPPDVHAVYDHGKRDVSSFPIATGTYYKVDYSPGTDISRYANIPVPTSYMAVNSAFDFVGGYHHGKQAGILHIANHHISPGKKQWTWGNGEFGKAWDRQLTDEDGPYFELMTGMFTDNQPDFGWIKPNEERSFCQYFLPYKNIGYVKNATIDAAVSLEVNMSLIEIKVYVTSLLKQVKICLRLKHKLLLEDKKDLSPRQTYDAQYELNEDFLESELLLEVFDNGNRLLVSYAPVIKKDNSIPEPANPIGTPASLNSNEELFLAARHLEQYRHATYSPVDYYEEALKRDPWDIRNNQGLGMWYLTRGKYKIAEDYFNTAIERLTKYNPNPYDTELFYQLGVALFYQKRYKEAYTAFYKTYWNKEWQDAGALFLARIDCSNKNYTDALKHTSNAIYKNYHSFNARHIKAAVLRLINNEEASMRLIDETLKIDHFQFGLLNEKYLLLKKCGSNEEAEKCIDRLNTLMRSAPENYIELSIDYAKAGLYYEATEVLERISSITENPLVLYYLAFYYSSLNEVNKVTACINAAMQFSPGTFFSNRLEDIDILNYIIQQKAGDYKAWYYLGNIWYDKKQYTDAIKAWGKSIQIFDGFATAHRNIGIAYFNREVNVQKAIASYEKAFELDKTDARVLFELDFLYKRANKTPEERLGFLKKYQELVDERDDLFIEFIGLHNVLGLHKEAANLLAGRTFHPWEGGEGKISGQFIITQIELAKEAITKTKYRKAVELLKAAEVYPINLGEGKLYGASENDIHFWLGCAFEYLNEPAQSLVYWRLAALGNSDPVPAIFYNDPSPDKILYQALALFKLNEFVVAEKLLKRLILYAEEHFNDEVKIDYFAVSLPDLSIFDDDLNKRNRIHCLYMEGLGYLGLQRWSEAERCFGQVIEQDASHQGALSHLKLVFNKMIIPARTL